MKAALLFVLTLSVALWAQVPQERGQGVTLSPTPPASTSVVTQADQPITHSDLYCAGYLSPQPVPRDSFVAGGLGTPVQSRFGTHDYIFLRGTSFTPGTRVSLVRAMRDPNLMEPFSGEGQRMKRAGQIYGDLGYAVIIGQRGNNTVAQVEFSCEDILPGDLVVPFEIRPEVRYRLHSTTDRFPAEAASLNGNIVGARDFDQYIGSNRKVYVNLGANEGLKPGAYLRIVRGYDVRAMDVTDAATTGQTLQEDTQKSAPMLPSAQYHQLPQRVVGEAIVLRTLPTTATAMITFALEDVHIGDRVELEPQQP